MLRDKAGVTSPIEKTLQLIRFRRIGVCLDGRCLLESLTPTGPGAGPQRCERSEELDRVDQGSAADCSSGTVTVRSAGLRVGEFDGRFGRLSLCTMLWGAGMDADSAKTNPQSLEMKGGATGGALREPWLRGTLGEVPAIARAVLHALELAGEDVRRWAGPLNDAQLGARAAGLPSVAFQMRHIGRSVDRLLTYAEGGALTEQQLTALKAEDDKNIARAELFAEFDGTMARSVIRVRALSREDPEQPRYVGKKRLPSSLGGLLVHVAEHTQRHVGQLVTTAKVVVASERDA